MSDRGARGLPMLEAHRAELETCVYCPKLSRAACPVSTVEASETTTPWGKMSMAYFVARGDVPLDAVHAETAWACTSCYGCRERCDHKTEVATVLGDARIEMFEAGVAPAAARRVSARFAEREREIASVDVGGDGAEAKVAVLVGCGYTLASPDVARDAVRAARALVGAPVRAVRGCCGLPLLHAGDARGFTRAAASMAATLKGAERAIVVDPGCARAVLVDYSRFGVASPNVELFVDLAAASIERFARIAEPPRAMRYHDPCQLGRGLGRYDEPRAVIAAATGRQPKEFQRFRAQAECSGAGGLLPATRPDSSRAMADLRLAEHASLGGGPLVTACASSLRRFRTRGAEVVDLVSLVARALAPQV